jgi:hypothetical protein
MPVEPKQVNFAANVTESKDKYLVNITKWVWQKQAYKI